MEVKQTRWLEENIIELIRKLRNDLIQDFLDERYMKQYVLDQYNIKELTFIKIEFVKQALKRLLESPVNVIHYGSLVNLIRETDTASLSKGNEQLFYAEIENVLKDYLF